MAAAPWAMNARAISTASSGVAVGHPVRGGDPDRDRDVLRDFGADRVEDLEGEA
jgi:hypothetical protein